MKILIVEDDPMVRSINIGFIHKMQNKHKIFEARNLTSAKAILTLESIDIILLDVYLGDEHGPDLLIWLRNKKYHCETILITADNSTETITEALMQGAIDYLIKPFNYKRFEEAFQKAMNRITHLKEKSVFDQDAIDDLIQSGATKTIKTEKGINQMTYQTVKLVLNEMETPKTAQEIADKTELARVTVRRYLEYMVEMGEVEEMLNYGKVGRPQKYYCLRSEDQR